MAADLRVKLFDRCVSLLQNICNAVLTVFLFTTSFSLLVLDMSFYDAQKTGELSSRLNSDVQEFKSSFKLTVAQGLRTFSQVFRSIVLH